MLRLPFSVIHCSTGPPSRIEQQLDAIAKLPKAEQRAVSTVLDAVLAQHGAQIGQEAVTAS